MIDKRFDVYIRHLPGGILYTWFYTEGDAPDFSVHTSFRNGILEIHFNTPTEKDKDKVTVETISLENNFNSYNYVYTTFKDKNEITIVCIPKDTIKSCHQRDRVQISQK